MNAFRWDGHAWHPDGKLRDTEHKAVVIDGLWAIAFGGGTPTNGPSNTLFFAAGPNDEAGGAFGTISLAP